jgi:hypothetical protein
LSFWSSNQDKPDRRDKWHVWGTKEMHMGVWWGQLRERDHSEYLGIDGKIYVNGS